MRFLNLSLALTVAALAGCDRGDERPAAPPAATEPSNTKDPAGSIDAPTEPAKKSASAPAAPHHSGEVIELGTTKIGDHSVRASRDQGELKPGADAPIDVWVDGGLGGGVTAVRFWIGAEDARGSLKAKAAVENGKWHTHVELPDPLPDGSSLWIELETVGGTLKGSVPLS